MTRRGILGASLGSLCAALSGCNLFAGTSSYRVLMTVEVDRPEGPYHASGVFSISFRRDIALTSEESGRSGGLRGEAIILDIGERPLFVTLKERPLRGSLSVAITRALSREDIKTQDQYSDAVGNLGSRFASAEGELPPEDWPIMVEFGDITDPSSVREVEPAQFGIKRIALQTTSRNISTGIVNQLPWLPDHRRTLIRRLSLPHPSQPPAAALLTNRDFSTEL